MAGKQIERVKRDLILNKKKSKGKLQKQKKLIYAANGGTIF